VLFYRFNHYDYRCKTPKTGRPVSEKNSSRQLVNSDNPALKAHFGAAVF